MEMERTTQEEPAPERPSADEVLAAAAERDYAAAQARQDKLARSLGGHAAPVIAYAAENGALATESEMRDLRERNRY